MAQADWLGLKFGGHLALMLHLSNESGELSQCQCHDDVVIHHCYCYYTEHERVFLGVNMPDHAAMLSSLHGLLMKNVTPHVVSLHSSKCHALKSAILNVALQLVPSLSSQVNQFVYCPCFVILTSGV